MTSNSFNKQDGVSLEKHFEKVITDLENSIDIRFKAMDDKNKVHFESLNNAASTLKDFKSTYVSMVWMEPRLDVMQKAIDNLELTRAVLAGKASNTIVVINYIITIILLVLTILDFFR